MTASVPELTIRTSSTDGTAPQTSSAISTSRSVAAPKLRPSLTARSTASRTTGWLCPRIIGPHEPT